MKSSSIYPSFWIDFIVSGEKAITKLFLTCAVLLIRAKGTAYSPTCVCVEKRDMNIISDLMIIMLNKDMNEYIIAGLIECNDWGFIDLILILLYNI